MDTERTLKLWRGGQAAAERLGANILHLDGFSSVDPQCPLGGPDGLKDVICEKNGWSYVGAAYFPGSDKSFREIKEKFLHDLEGVSKNGVDGIIFITNQSISPTERKELIGLAAESSSKAIIYHLERIRLLLDSPSGYGLRLEYLDIDMSREEQLSFFSQWNRSFSELLKDHGMMIVNELSKKIDSLKEPEQLLERKVHEFIEATQSAVAMNLERLEKSSKSNILLPHDAPATSTINIESLCMLHRALLMDHPHANAVGKLRELAVWIGGADSTIENAIYVPPPPEEVIPLTRKLLDDWVSEYNSVRNGDEKEKLEALTRFHSEFLRIHPFLDGNGRIARFLLMQQASELLGYTQRIVIEERKPYFDAINRAIEGNIEPLETIITQAIYGVEFIAGSPCKMAGQPCPAPSCDGVMDIDSSQSGVQCVKCGLFISA